ncbi:hypothetical protein LCGC14_1518700, partial [marine sediment metagenome]
EEGEMVEEEAPKNHTQSQNLNKHQR